MHTRAHSDTHWVCQTYLMILNQHTHMHTPHTYLRMCVLWLGISVWVNSNITSVTQTHPRALLHTCHSTKLSQAHTRTISIPGESDVSCKRPAQQRKRLDKLKMHTHTHTHTSMHGGTFSSHNVDIILLSRALLSACCPSEAVCPCWALSGINTLFFF